MNQITYNQETLTITHVVRPWQNVVRRKEQTSEKLLKKYKQLQGKARKKMLGADPVALIREQRD